MPAADFPPDYLPPGGRKGDSGCVDVRKALWVAERVLGRRSPKAAYVFAQQLNGRAEPILAAELDSYFVSPGSYGAELQQVGGRRGPGAGAGARWELGQGQGVVVVGRRVRD